MSEKRLCGSNLTANAAQPNIRRTAVASQLVALGAQLNGLERIGHTGATGSAHESDHLGDLAPASSLHETAAPRMCVSRFFLTGKGEGMLIVLFAACLALAGE